MSQSNTDVSSTRLLAFGSSRRSPTLDRTLRAGAIALAGSVVLSVPGIVWEWRILADQAPRLAGSAVTMTLVLLLDVAIAAASLLILWRDPRQSVAWLLLAQSLLLGPIELADGAADIGYFTSSAVIGHPGVWADLSESTTVLNFAVLAALLVVFPSGRACIAWSRRLLRSICVVFSLWFVERLIHPGPFGQGDEMAHKRNPLGVPLLNDTPWRQIDHLWLPIGGVLMLTALVHFAWRAYRSAGDERQQMKAVGLGLLIPTMAVVGLALMGILDPAVMPALGDVEFYGALLMLPAGVTIALLRFRLYDVDVVINRTVVYGLLSLLLSATYVVGVLLVGRVVVGAGWTSPWAVAAATLACAGVASPARTQIQRLVDRAFNRRAWNVRRQLESLTTQWRTEPASAEGLRIVLAGALGDPSLELWFWLRNHHAWADTAGRLEAAPLPDPIGQDRMVTALSGVDGRTAMLVHSVGAGRDPSVLRAVRTHAALLVDNARLRAEAMVQVAELQASRGRIIAAADESRRKVERDLHDGAQQHLVALALRAKLAARAQTDQHAQRAMIQLADEVQTVLSDIRNLARGIHPASMEEGITPALEKLSQRLPIDVHINLPEQRFSPEVELSAYFVAAEAITNAVKHAACATIWLTGTVHTDRLVMSVTDDGRGGGHLTPGGGLVGLQDRVAALGGALSVQGAPGHGTLIRAELPCG